MLTTYISDPVVQIETGSDLSEKKTRSGFDQNNRIQKYNFLYCRSKADTHGVHFGKKIYITILSIKYLLCVHQNTELGGAKYRVSQNLPQICTASA